MLLLWMLLALWTASAVAAAALLNRHDHAGTGFLWGLTLPNQRLKLSGCGGRLKGNGLVLIAAAAPRSLSAIR